MKKLTSAISLAVVLTALVVAGCGRLPAQVSGVVTLDGKPLSTGTVAFHPQAAGTTAVSVINQAGRYQLKTGQANGLIPGRYTVTVTALSGTPSSEQLDPAELAKLFITPRRYAEPGTSNLACDVIGGEQTYDIALTSQE